MVIVNKLDAASTIWLKLACCLKPMMCPAQIVGTFINLDSPGTSMTIHSVTRQRITNGSRSYAHTAIIRGRRGVGKTKIEWATDVWNPIRGCSVVSEGCRHCYAMQVAARFSGEGQAYEGLAYRNSSGAHWTGKVRLIEEHLEDPLRWKRPRRIFVNSMSDLFHEGLSNEQIVRVFQVMSKAPQHIFQVLTKRPERMRDFIRLMSVLNEACTNQHEWPLKNVWLGVSIEDQKTADERIPLLLQTPAAVRWLSVEPLLGPIDFGNPKEYETDSGDYSMRLQRGLFGIDWAVIGGESGPGARPMDLCWMRSIMEQCSNAGVPVFVKQLGARPYDPSCAMKDNPGWLGYIDRKGGDINEWPEDLRVREYPS